ncbi:class I SAM-dependent methyltransferase [Rhodopseudomonas palustris]|uniref:Class I SAM-dependent methyltransferase n=1 Tax=Thiospirillum jenense TaxID=1653858 RepID=A0A839HG88_9GAMM|nr:class I SAM-dependent methyltransferase [Thiospirillum jenense]MBB1091966.1 class I SAM-dependent methyltransferase [Rhodopseudomonas palustris]MBB1126316.1 class I SAM-dependent methyltransferase [Thiospirillum jenense]
MSDDHSSIHEFDFQLICEYFAGLERQGPGSRTVTLQALQFIDTLTPNAQIADIGCGTGGQTMVLAEYTAGHIVGIDLFPKFIDLFNANARRLHYQDRVHGIVGDMTKRLPFANGSLDVIWSEGAIYNIGFERGLNEWRPLLKTGSFIAVSEASWFTPQRPDEINAFWQDAYPGIDTIPNKVAQMQAAGYLPIATFVLPETCWTEQFYLPQIAAQEAFLRKYPHNEMAMQLVTNERREAQLYAQYKAYYGYVFYIGKTY